MAEVVRRIDYYYASVPDKPGEAARILSVLHQAGVNLLGFTGFPEGARKAQLDFLPEDPAAFAKAARQAGLKLSKKKAGFLIQGDDRPGAVAELMGKLAAAGDQRDIHPGDCRRSGPLQRHPLGQGAGCPQSRQGASPDVSHGKRIGARAGTKQCGDDALGEIVAGRTRRDLDFHRK